LPTVSLPLLRGMNGMPIGVQLVGWPRGDRNLLSVAAWLTDTVTPTVETSHEQA